MNPSKKGKQALTCSQMKTITGGFIVIDDISTTCFAEDTLIKTQTGEKMIKDLDLATDRVWNPMNRQWMKMSRKTVSLVEGMAYTIATTAGTVTVTANHPFMTTAGEILTASELNEGDLLADGSSGDLVTAVTAFVIEDYMIVHNLVFATTDADNANHFVEANGVVSGVLHLQDKVQHRTPITRIENQVH